MTRVLYVHGLESGPTGHKARLLAEAGFEVSAVQMPCGRRHALREPLVAVWALSSLSLVGFAAWSTAPWLVTVEDDHRLSATATAASLHAWVESVRSPPTA